MSAPQAAPFRADLQALRPPQSRAAARDALEALNELPRELNQSFASHHRLLTEKIEKRRVLNEDFRHAAQAVLYELSRMEVSESNVRIYSWAMKRLREAVNGSHRVADLLAAEHDIGWYRGIRS
jgi:hypothetical protein